MEDRRAVSEVVGAVLLFGIVVVSLSLYQATVVPAENQRVEFQHSQRVQDQLTGARNALLQVGSTGAANPVSVSLGTRYPTRVATVNPPPVSGSLRTEPYASNLSIRNVRATNAETAQYVNGTLSFSTERLVYRGQYHEYADAPAVVDSNGLLYSQFRRANLTVTDQSLVSGNRLSLVALSGDYAQSGVSATTLDPQASSAPATAVAVHNRSAGPLVLSVPTRLPASAWRNTSLADESRVERVTAGPGNTVDVSLKPGTYVLKLSRVGLGRGVPNPGPEYVTTVSGNGTSLPAGGSQSMTVAVHDRFDNAVSGVRVNASTPSGGSVSFPNGPTTDENGQVTMQYHAPTSVPGDTPVTVYAGFGAPATWKVTPRGRADVHLTVTSASSNGGGGSSSGSTTDAMRASNAGTFWGSSGVQFDLTNGGSSNRTITALNVTGTSTDASAIEEHNGGTGKGMNEMYVSSPTGAGHYDAGDNGNEAYALGRTASLTTPVSVQPGNAATVSLYAFVTSAKGSQVDMQGATVTVRVTYSDGSTATYTVRPS